MRLKVWIWNVLVNGVASSAVVTPRIRATLLRRLGASVGA